ncbi:MAG: 1,4-alpha-glucan branching protein GlgB [Nannocystis sp.]|nr:1,4-alpha-glucan branching protein GlgB [Nannocystis sp.]
MAIDVDVPPAPAALADDAEADALAGDVAPIPAAYLATPPRTPSPVVYLADLPTADQADPHREPLARPDPRLSDYDRHLFAEGKHLGLFDKLGAQLLAEGGVHFAVWAPNAESVRVMGEFNGWDPDRDLLQRDAGGVWSGVVTGARAGMLYKYRVVGLRGEVLDKADPCAQATELPPETASRIADVTHRWNDGAWLAGRAQRQAMSAPMSVYELHLGSWMRGPEQEFLSYREVAPHLIAHVQALGFTHVEFMPLTEHPFHGSWGYQSTGYYAPTARFGAPEDLMALIDRLHQAGIGVILDWVPAHFPADAHGLAHFDGTRLYEHHDWRRGLHPDWNTLIFNLSRPEVQSFLLSSVMLWIERFHIDGIRVDAVASMLYLDYSRKEGDWAPNEHGGRENLESVAFLRELNRVIHERHPGVLTIAEDSTAWPLVTAPSATGGLGFDLKWDMGWMHDTLRYLGRDPIDRQHHHNELTFRMMYAYKERFMLPLSHDEVVHGKGSLVRKMHGDSVAKFAGLRLLFGYMFTSPGHKLLFMGDEFAQVREWNHDQALDWALREQPRHAGLERWVQRIAHLYRDEPGLHELDHDPAGFEWLIVDDRQRSLIVNLRLPASGPAILVALNFTPVTWTDQRIGLPGASRWTLLTRSDAPEFTDQPETPAIPLPQTFEAAHDPTQDRAYALTLTVPPLAAVLLKGPDAAEMRAAANRARSEKLAREAAQVAVAAAAAAAARAAAEAEATVLMPPETDVEPKGATGQGAATGAQHTAAQHTGAQHTAAIVADGKPDLPGSVGER